MTSTEAPPEIAPAGALTSKRLPSLRKRRRLRARVRRAHVVALESYSLGVALKVEAAIRARLDELFREQGIVTDALLPGVQLLFDLLSNQLVSIVTDPEIAGFLDGLANKVETSNTRDQRRLFNLKIGRVGLDAGLETVRAQFIRNNIALITSLAGRQLDTLRDIFETERIGVNASARTITAKVEEAFGQKKWQARRIATDQIRTLNSQMTSELHKRAGITHYIWTTVKTNVRESHEALEGQRIAYAQGAPSLDGANVGDEINCQCFAFPLI